MSLSIFSATVEVKLMKKMIDELERSTKKKTPSKLKIELIYVIIEISMYYVSLTPMQTPKNQCDPNLSQVGARSIFQGLCADLNKCVVCHRVSICTIDFILLAGVGTPKSLL